MRSRDPTPQDSLADQLEGTKYNGSHHRSQPLFAIEMRSTTRPLHITDKIVITERWARMPITQSPFGIQVHPWEQEAAKHGFYPYEAAKALQAWGLSNARTAGGVGAQSRLVRVKWVESFSYTEDGIVDEEDLDEAMREAVNGPVRMRRPDAETPDAS